MANAATSQRQDGRERLLEAAAAIAREHGLAAVTTAAVCQAASVTKGALFYHFAAKDDLIEAMFARLIDLFDQEIEARMAAAQAQRQGAFTRAYVEATLDAARSGEHPSWSGLSAYTVNEPRLWANWYRWLKQRLDGRSELDRSVRGYLARYAADGIWIAALSDALSADELNALKAEILSTLES